MATFSLNGLEMTLPDALMTAPIRKMIDNGWYEIDEVKALKMNLRPEDRVLEIGGGMGYIAAMSARTVGASQVTTVEANPEMVPVIRRNLEANGFPEVDIRHGVAVAKKGQGHAEFFLPRSFWAASINPQGLKGAPKSIEVPTLSMTELIEETQPTFLMIDVEGAEADFFMSRLPATLRVIVLELHQNKYPRHVIRDIFRRLDQQDFVYQPNGSHAAVVCFERI